MFTLVTEVYLVLAPFRKPISVVEPTKRETAGAGISPQLKGSIILLILKKFIFSSVFNSILNLLEIPSLCDVALEFGIHFDWILAN
jgi:hypothetical protein